MKSRFGPLGFELVKSEYVRKRDAQLMFVTFSAEKYGHGFDVNVALHFDYLPPFTFQSWPGAPIPTDMGSELCAFQRLIRGAKGNQYYEYGKTEADAEKMVSKIADRIELALDAIGETVGDGRPLLNVITPDVLVRDFQTFTEMFSAESIEEQDRISDSMQIRQLFPDWNPHVVPTAILMAYIARHFSQDALAARYVDVAHASRPEHHHLSYLDALTK